MSDTARPAGMLAASAVAVVKARLVPVESPNQAATNRVVIPPNTAFFHEIATASGDNVVPRVVTKCPTGFSGAVFGASTTPSSPGTGQFPMETGADGASSGGVTPIPPVDRSGTLDTYPFSTN
ncbi:hypothetical protein ACL02S_04330 [Nocardia sp. 004]|uniref:hypothetical protein n=1 Tax=Nocardia sp. 004 TaxID=3385978 RepID=UPI0039A3D2DA